MKTNFTMLVHSRPRLLQQAFDSIGDTSTMHFSIYADNPTIEVLAMARGFMQNKEGTLCATRDSKGTGHARNAVISMASNYRSDYLYLSDDDVCFLHPLWLTHLIHAYEKAWEQGVRVIGAYNHPYHQPLDFFDGGYEVYALALQSMLMRWEVWDKYGPFRETPPGAVCQGEDCDFGNAIRADGLRLGVITPPLLANCGITNSFGARIPGWEMVRAEAPEGVIVE